MATTRAEHIVTGGGTFVCRILQFLCSVVIVGLSGYGLYYLQFTGVQLNMATAVITTVGTVYFILATTLFTKLYNYWAALAFDVVSFCLWVASFGLMVYQIRPFYVDYYAYDACTWFYYGVCFYKRSESAASLLEKRAKTNWYTYRNTMGGIAALAGIEWIMFLITFLTVSIEIARHRRQGGHALASYYQSRLDVEKRGSEASHSIVSQPAPGISAPGAIMTA